ncbi:MAG: hypothetical protein AB7E55_26185 [Pigmentiphaga sp.]
MDADQRALDIASRYTLASQPQKRAQLQADIAAAIRDEREAALGMAALVIEQHDKAGREWAPGSFWDAVTREAAGRIRALTGKAGS